MSSITTGRGGGHRDFRPHYVYQFWDKEGRCLYIGMTASPAGRIGTHASSSPWWRYVDNFSAEVYPGREAAREAETALINRHQPKWNYYHTEASAGSRSGATLGTVNWRKADVIS